MTQLPPPPVPAELRKKLHDYPEYLQTLQQNLSEVVERPLGATPLFEQAIWALEEALGVFMSDARRELEAAKRAGDPGGIERARRKDFVAGSARLDMGDLSDLQENLKSRELS